MNSLSCPETLSSDELDRRLLKLAADDRADLVEFLRHLGELDRRRLYLPLGFTNIHQYCVRKLKLSDGSANRRYTAARLLLQFPAVAGFIVSGKLTLKRLCLLRKVLTQENHLDLLERAGAGTELDVEALAAGLAPKPEVKDSVRRLFVPTPLPPPPAAPVEVPAPPIAPSAEQASPSSTPAELFALVAPIVKQRMEVIATSGNRFSVRMNVSKEFLDLFEKLQSLLSHVVPDGSFEDVMIEAFRSAIEVIEKRRRGSDDSSKARPQHAPAKGRHIPAEVRKAAWKRDGGHCAYVAPDGTRCGGTFQVQFHHLHAFAKGGAATIDNVSLRCRSHNDYEAVRDFGAEHMAAAKCRRVTSTGGSQTLKTGHPCNPPRPPQGPPEAKDAAGGGVRTD